MTDLKHVNLKIFGKVIGVNFRDFAQSLANELGVVGFAQNQPEDFVYIEAEGEEMKIKEFIARLQAGNNLAKVEKIEAEEGAMKNFADFLIRY